MYLLQLDTKERKLFLELAHFVAMADGVIVEQEEEMLERYRDEMNLSHKEYELQNMTLESVLNQIKDSQRSVKRAIFLELLAVAFSDGVYDPAQKDTMDTLRQAFEISSDEYESFKLCIRQISELYEQINELVYES